MEGEGCRDWVTGTVIGVSFLCWGAVAANTLRRVWQLERRVGVLEARPPSQQTRDGPPPWVDAGKWERDEAGRRAVAGSVAKQDMEEHRARLEEAAKAAFLQKPGDDGEEESVSSSREPSFDADADADANKENVPPEHHAKDSIGSDGDDEEPEGWLKPE